MSSLIHLLLAALLTLTCVSSDKDKGHTIIVRNEEMRHPIPIPVPVPVPVPYFHKSFSMHKGIGGLLGVKRHDFPHAASHPVPASYHPTQKPAQMFNFYPMAGRPSYEHNLLREWMAEQQLRLASRTSPFSIYPPVYPLFVPETGRMPPPTGEHGWDPLD